jgi:hypothetical protein
MLTGEDILRLKGFNIITQCPYYKILNCINDSLTELYLKFYLLECNSMEHLLNPGFLLDLFFYPEDGRDIFLRNVG